MKKVSKHIHTLPFKSASKDEILFKASAQRSGHWPGSPLYPRLPVEI